MASSRQFCESCGTPLSETANFCPHCGASKGPGGSVPVTTETWRTTTSNASASQSQSRRGILSERKQILGLAGSVVLFIGVFTPIVSLPIVGTMNYFQNGKGDGVIVLILAVISLLLILRNRYRWLWATGLLSLALMVYTLVNFQLRVAEMQAQMQEKLANNPFKGIADVAMKSVQIQWGWAVMIVGAALLIAAAAIRESSPHDDAV